MQIALTVVLTLVAVFIAVNLMGGEKKIERRFKRIHSVDDPGFAYELGVLLGPPLLHGNRHTALHNGEQIFPAMLAAVRSAKTTLTFETFIYWSGDIGREFAQALDERARAGVKVHVLLDWVGSQRMESSLVDEMKSAGVQVYKFHPPHWTHLPRFNNRTHRKLLVVDGRLAFTGGVGIAPQWTGRAQDPQHWRDSHFQIEGPVVAQMQSVFLSNWVKVTGEVLHGPAYFPALPAAGDSAAQMFSSSPSGGSESMQLMYLMAISSASRSIDLAASYFVPDDLVTAALVEALRRGVKVRVIVPGERIDKDVVRAASRARWGPLLEAGALIAEYQPTMFHCKVMIVDQLLVSVGSTNFDHRSFRLNDEANLNILDAAFADQQSAVFEADLQNSRPITLAQWQGRPRREKFKERLAALLRMQL
ncbi:MAG: phospholipase D-like domain-containing protein [Rubrivivax sp.]